MPYRGQPAELGIYLVILSLEALSKQLCCANSLLARAQINNNLYMKGLANNPLKFHILPNSQCITSNSHSEILKPVGLFKSSLKKNLKIKLSLS